jgi:hypothetical protein
VIDWLVVLDKDGKQQLAQPLETRMNPVFSQVSTYRLSQSENSSHCVLIPYHCAWLDASIFYLELLWWRVQRVFVADSVSNSGCVFRVPGCLWTVHVWNSQSAVMGKDPGTCNNWNSRACSKYVMLMVWINWKVYCILERRTRVCDQLLSGLRWSWVWRQRGWG